jgi:NADH-quinone oxidoreductase subunit L
VELTAILSGLRRESSGGLGMTREFTVLVIYGVLATIALVVAVIGIVWAWLKYHRAELPAEDGMFWRRSREAAFSVDGFYGRTIVEPGKKISEWDAEVFDPKVLDGVSRGIGSGVRSFAGVLAKLQTGQVRSYAGAVAVAGVLLIILFLAVGGGF